MLLVATAFVLVRARRANAPQTPSMFGPIAIFVLGLGAFVATRAEAHDVRSPMPLRSMGNAVRASWALSLPPASGCESLRDAPLLTHDERGFFLFDDQQVEIDAELRTRLASLRGLWKQVQPNKPYPNVISMALPATMPMADVEPVLATLRATEHESIEVIEVFPAERWPTRTLGPIAYRPRLCSIHVPDIERLPRARTWGEMANGLAR
ncbi:Hypothetical protein A7982_10098 [Minicystis rosea]|nr:Hypothetical protein A7982_10098 [Minicystis rosea]